MLIQADTGQGRRQAATKIGSGKLYYMLSNPIYIGQIRQGSEAHRGEHEPIIDPAVFAQCKTAWRNRHRVPEVRPFSATSIF